jgi:phosphoglycolate phosphatase
MQPHSVLEARRGLIFDFDGTLIDSYAAMAASVNHVRAHHNLPPLSVEEVKCHVGRGPGHLLRNTVGGRDQSGDQAIYRAHHPHVMRGLTHLLPGAREVLEAIRRTGRRAAICSNKPRDFTKELLSALNIAEFIGVVVGPEDVAHPKPAPDMLVLALAQLHIQPHEALYVGDMEVDIEAGRAAGLEVWIVPTGSDTLATLQKARPDYLLRDLAELATAL